jgi:hypothetical protein
MIFNNSPVTNANIVDPTTFALPVNTFALVANNTAGNKAANPPSMADMAEESKPNGLPLADQAKAEINVTKP